ncbi:MAG TPA: hypothetical protein VK116_00040, partial [Planctomycetota bacterium]|nr:hypothetical protein [Planctomycetota bacterium]
LRPIRGWAVAPLAFPRDEKPQPSIITIGSSDGRVAIHRLSEKKTDGSLGSARLLPLGGDGGTRIIGDLDRDGRLDHISSDLDAARLRVRFQDEDGSFSRQDDFPTYSGVNGLACASVDLEPGAEIVVISRKEQAIGVASWKDGRLYFPQTLRLPAEIGTDFRPLLLGAETRKRGEGTNERATLFVVTEGESSSHHLVLLEADGEDARLVSRTKLETGGTAPNAMRVFDANGDGLADVLLFVPYSDPFLYLQEEAKETIAEAAGETKTGATGDAGEKSTAAASESAATNDTKASDSNADSASIRFVEVSRGRDFGRGQLAELRPESFDVMPSSDGEA